MFYDEGYEAYATGLSLENNPHKAGSPEAKQWELGWSDACCHDCEGIDTDDN